MIQYQSLFTLTAKHNYYIDGYIKSFSYQFDSQSLRVLENADAIVKNNSIGIQILSTGRTLEIFQDIIEEYHTDKNLEADDENPLEKPFLLLRLYDKSFSFNQITSTSIVPNQNCYFVHNELKDFTQSHSLHQNEFLSNEEPMVLSDQNLKTVINHSDWVNTPIVFVKIFLEDLLNHYNSLINIKSQVEYSISFNAKINLWKYLIFGHEKYEKLSVLDADNQITFQYQGKEVVGEQESVVYLSSKPILLKEKFEQRFQLKNESHNINRVLVKRLPVASTMQVNTIVLNGKQTAVSEIFVTI